ncbi:hypothetical protein BWI17_13715 [Betaproteobacteria bacterium GR16-43]|nr:hypothetical protein BWI17_13715 [Betaproteobacteria bacterium GR16-43]
MTERASRSGLLALAALALASCATAPVSKGPAVAELPREIALKNPGFETAMPANSSCAPGWGCSAHSDLSSFTFTLDATGPAEGAASFRVQRVKREPWALVLQAVEDARLRGKRLRFSLSVRTEDVAEGAGIFMVAQNAGGTSITHDKALLKGTTPWTRQSLEFVVPEATQIFEVGVTLEGPGRVWIDAARLEILSP